MVTKKKVLDLGGLLDEMENEVDEEIEGERMRGLSAEDQVLSQIATDILRLERDMTKPGQAVQDLTRIERLTKFIDETSF